MTDPGEKGANAPQFFGNKIPQTSHNGGGGSGEQAMNKDNPAYNSAGNAGGGQAKADSKTVSHNIFTEDGYKAVASTGSTSPAPRPIAGDYPTDTGAGSGNVSTPRVSKDNS